jgi:hypothetical protein
MVDLAGDEYWTIAVWTYGTVEILFKWMRKKQPFDTESKRRELREKLNAIQDVSIPEDGIERRPNVSLQVLTVPGALDRFLEVLDWVVNEIRSQPGSQDRV